MELAERLIDRRVLGRPPTFDGKDGEWTTWAFVVSNYVAASVPAGEAFLEEAARRDAEIEAERLTADGRPFILNSKQ